MTKTNYFIINYIGRPVGESGESCKSEFDLKHACPECGTGAKIKGNLISRGLSKCQKKLLITLDGDLILSGELYRQIKMHYPIIQLRKIVDKRSEKLDFFHLDSEIILPPFQKSSNGYVIEDQCGACERNGYFNDAIIGDLDKGIETFVRPLKLTYKLADFKSKEEVPIIKTWECIGASNKESNGKYVQRFARPWIIIDQKMKELLEEEKIKNIEFIKLLIELED